MLLLLLLPGELNGSGESVKLLPSERASWSGPQCPESVVGFGKGCFDKEISLSGLEDGREMEPQDEVGFSQLMECKVVVVLL